MPRFDDEAFVLNAFGPHLKPAERILNHAFGVKRPNLFILIFGVIIAWLLTKEYLVATTNRGRFIVLRFSGKLTVKEVMTYRRDQLRGLRTKSGPLFTHIDIDDPLQPFSAKFHRRGLKDNRSQAIAIAQSLAVWQRPSPGTIIAAR